MTGKPDIVAVGLGQRFKADKLLYRDHRDAISTYKAFLGSHGMEYVKTELKYATQNSTIVTGFPAFLKRALKSGWGTDTSRVNQTLDEKKGLAAAKTIKGLKNIING
ncbi:MAG: hypothetical protein V2B19_09585 [Pseudomonadota bacterium]